MKLKQITKIIALCALLMLGSCEKDIYNEENITTSKVIVKKVSLKDAIAKNNYTLIKAVEKLKEKQKNIASKMVYDTTYNFYYDDENGKYMKYNDMVSFTFPIIKENDEKLKNIVFSLKNNNEFEIYLTEYDLTEEEKEKLQNDQPFIPENEIKIDELYKATADPCYKISKIPLTYDSHGQITSSYFYAEEIPCPGTGGGGTNDYSSSEGTNPLYGNGGYPGGTPSGSTSNPTGTGNNTGLNGGGGGGGSSPIITTPVPSSGYTLAQYNFIQSLNTTSNLGTADNFMYLVTEAQNSIFSYVNEHNTNIQLYPVRYFFQNTNLLWISKQPDETQISIFKYLVQNSFSTTSRTFVNEIINASQVLEINAMLVWEDYDNFRNQMSSSEKIIFDGLSSNRKLWYMCSAKKARDKAEELFPLNSLHNGKGDAFRHALWNGLCALTLAGNLGEQLTTAHENKPAPPNDPFNYKETEMDLYNNEKGRQVAILSNLTNITDHVLQDLNNGYLRYLNNLNPVNGQATYNSLLIPTNQ